MAFLLTQEKQLEIDIVPKSAPIAAVRLALNWLATAAVLALRGLFPYSPPRIRSAGG